MKYIFSALLLLSSASAMAMGSIVIPTEDNKSIEIQWLGTEADESEVELAWELGGQKAVFNGAICFKGLRKEAILVLEYLDQKEFLGDEYRLQDIHFVGRDKISYEVFDGPNQEVVTENVISACGK